MLRGKRDGRGRIVCHGGGRREIWNNENPKPVRQRPTLCTHCTSWKNLNRPHQGNTNHESMKIRKYKNRNILEFQIHQTAGQYYARIARELQYQSPVGRVWKGSKVHNTNWTENVGRHWKSNMFGMFYYHCNEPIGRSSKLFLKSRNLSVRNKAIIVTPVHW